MREITRTVLLCAAWFVAHALAAGDPADPAERGDSEIRDYQLVFLSEREDWEPPLDEHPARAERIEKGRQFHLAQLQRAGAGLLAGDILDGKSLKVVAILDVGGTAEARTAFEHSPGVASGRLEIEVFSWSSVTGSLKPLESTENPEEFVSVWLALLERPSNAPHFPKEELQQLQEGHLQHLEELRGQGDLVIAGQVEHGDGLEGALVFRTADRERVEGLVQSDPLVKAGRLVPELYRWQVPRASVPAG